VHRGVGGTGKVPSPTRSSRAPRCRPAIAAAASLRLVLEPELGGCALDEEELQPHALCASGDRR
jgi:hypothetical protein